MTTNTFTHNGQRVTCYTKADKPGWGIDHEMWVRSNLPFEAVVGMLQNGIWITGSRSSTAYGQHVAATIAHATAERRTVITGANFGIEEAASRAMLAVRRPQIVVLAGGFMEPWPIAKRELLDRIVDQGGAIIWFNDDPELTEWDAPKGRAAFVKRDEALATWARTVVYVEGIDGTPVARARAGRNCQTWAVPGPITSSTSAGPNKAIASGEAKALHNVDDFLAHI